MRETTEVCVFVWGYLFIDCSSYPFVPGWVLVPSAKKKNQFRHVPLFCAGREPGPSCWAWRAGPKGCCQHSQTRNSWRVMSGDAAFVSSCAQDDDSDRGEDQDYVPSFVVTVTAGDEVVSRRFDDTHNDGDSEAEFRNAEFRFRI